VKEEYIGKVDEMCQGIYMGDWTGCYHFHDIAVDGLNRVRRVEELIYEVTSKQGYKTFRRGVLNFAGKISKILFDTVYNEQIERFKQNADSLTELTKTHTHI
jgi:hypothetical protein